jgi:hypothetical protein
MRKQYFIIYSLLCIIFAGSCGTDAAKSYKLFTFVDPTEGGIVEPAGGEFQEGETVVLKAKPSEGWIFKGWSGDLDGNENPIPFTMEKSVGITAEFERRVYPLTLDIKGEGTVREEVIREKASEYAHDTVVQLTPLASSGWRFKEWGGDHRGDDIPLEVRISGETLIEAVFEKVNSAIITIGGSLSDMVRSAVSLSDGSIILTGYTVSNDGEFEMMRIGSDDIFVVKLSRSAEIEWIRVFGESELDQGYSVTETSDGGIVISGKSFRSRWNSVVLKLDTSGNVVWEKIFFKSSGESIDATDDGGVVVTGFSSSNEGVFEGQNLGESDIYIMKINRDGEVEWVKNIGGSDGDVGYNILVTSDGGYLVSGFAYSRDGNFEGIKESPYLDLFLMKTDHEGKILWTRIFDDDSMYSMVPDIVDLAETGQGKYRYTYSDCKAGESLGSSICRFHLLQFNADGDMEWQRTYQGSEGESAHAMVITSDGGTILTGNTSSTDGDFSGVENKGSSDILVMKTDVNGEVEWIQNYGGSSGERGEAITQVPDGNFAISGLMFSNDGDFQGMNRGITDIFVIKIDPHGNLLQSW